MTLWGVPVKGSGLARHREHDFPGGLQHQADVELAGDVDGALHQQPLHRQAADLEAHHFLRRQLGLFRVAHQAHATGAGTPRGQHLRLDHDAAGKLRRHLVRLTGRVGHRALGHGDAVPLQDALSLVLV